MDAEYYIGQNIKTAREAKNWSQKKLAEATRISNTLICSYETGKRTPGLSTLALIAEALDVSIDELYFGDNNVNFITKAGDDGHKIANCVYQLFKLGAIDGSITLGINGPSMGMAPSFREPISRLLRIADEVHQASETYPDPDLVIDQLLESVAAEINLGQKQRQDQYEQERPLRELMGIRG